MPEHSYSLTRVTVALQPSVAAEQTWSTAQVVFEPGTLGTTSQKMEWCNVFTGNCFNRFPSRGHFKVRLLILHFI